MIVYLLLAYIGVKIYAPLWYWVLWILGLAAKGLFALAKAAAESQ